MPIFTVTITRFDSNGQPTANERTPYNSFHVFNEYLSMLNMQDGGCRAIYEFLGNNYTYDDLQRASGFGDYGDIDVHVLVGIQWRITIRTFDDNGQPTDDGPAAYNSFQMFNEELAILSMRNGGYGAIYEYLGNFYTYEELKYASGFDANHAIHVHVLVGLKCKITFVEALEHRVSEWVVNVNANHRACDLLEQIVCNETFMDAKQYRQQGMYYTDKYGLYEGCSKLDNGDYIKALLNNPAMLALYIRRI